MNSAFDFVLAANPEDRRGLFATTAQRLNISENNVEKDFWVCWTLDALFNGLPEGSPRLLFKGGTSLSKAYGLIQRFSEDIDITVFREDIGQTVSFDELEAMSGKKRKAQIDEIRNACSEYINSTLLQDLGNILARTLDQANIPADAASVVADESDQDQQTLLVQYPRVTDADGDYFRPVVRIESGAKSALDPHESRVIVPYVAEDLGGDIDFSIENVTTVDANRTFWDKVVILHGQRNWFEKRGSLYQEGQRVSRHYYDVHKLLVARGNRPLESDEWELALNCARHARMFFPRPDFNLESAISGNFRVTPLPDMIEGLRRDYINMSGMIFDEIPRFEEVIDSVTTLEAAMKAFAPG
jgi:Nucleotidyl transferase AbiEii toxin, Type IV TA system